jgi:hypothetical protein
MAKDKKILVVTLLVAIIALVLSVVAISIPNNKAAVDETVFEKCGLKSGEIPSQDFKTCREHCAAVTDRTCVIGFWARPGGDLYPMGCDSSLGQQSNEFADINSYQCVCC